MPLAPGTRLGFYEILAPLGAGGMGEVYRARDSRLGREVALKILPETLASSPDRLARFEREAKTVASLNHPNIVTLHTIEEAGAVRFLVMEVVEGSDLTTLIAPGGLPLVKILEVAIPLADALVSAHEKRVVHRDLKPANVMLTREGRVKVLDFGLAKLVEIGADVDLTRAASMQTPISTAGEVAGTVPYMAPEQIRGEEVDARTDVFSFGILLYELAAGTRPFEGRTFADISSSILRDSPPSLSRMRPDLPSDLARIVERCLEKNPRERYQTALDVANELRTLKRLTERKSSPAAASAPAPAPSAEAAQASIAVLPFVNRSASSEDEYFSDGLADELINLLAKIRGLRVAARTSVFQFKGRHEDITEIGRKLKVATLLDGSVRKAGNRVRISVELVKASDGYPLWSETYDRTLEDIFAVQDDIARSVVKELRSALLGEEADSHSSGEVKAEVAQAAQDRTMNPEAHRLRLLARHLLSHVTREETAKAIEYLKEALNLDPQYAGAWVTLAAAYSNQGGFGWAPLSDVRRLALEAAERAVTLNPRLAEAHSLLAYILYSTLHDWRRAELEAKKALELAPGDFDVLRRFAVLKSTRGHVEEGIALMRRALELDPLNPGANFSLGNLLSTLRRDAEAELALRRSLELAPERAGTHAWLGLTLMRQGRTIEALAEVEKEPEEIFRLWSSAIIHHALADEGKSRDYLEKLIARFGAVAAMQIAQIHAARGEVDAAFEWLERGIGKDAGLTEARANTWLQPLHSDPRWAAFLKKMGHED